jgi:putative NADH-flavin reductase
MEVVLYGATGKAGSRFLKELTNRGHQVTAVARNVGQLPLAVERKRDDLSNVDAIAAPFRMPMR